MKTVFSAFKQKFFYLVLILLAFIPLFPKFPVSEVSGTYVAVRAEDFFIAFVLLLFGVLYVHKVKKLFSEPMYLAFMLFFFIGFVSLLSAMFVTNSVQWHLGILHWARRVEYMAFFFLGAWTITSLSRVKLMLKAFFLVVLFVTVYGFGQVFLNFPVISTTNREFSKGQILYLTPGARVNSTFAGHYDLAIFMSMVLMVLCPLFFYYRKIVQKSWITIVGLLSFAMLGMTAARASFAATVFGLAVSFWLIKKKWLIVLLIFASVFAVAVIPDLRHRLVATITVNILGGGGPKYDPTTLNTVVGEKLTEDVRQQILEQATLSGENGSEKLATVSSDIAPGEPIDGLELAIYRSFGIRSDVSWPRAINAFQKNPVLGLGYSSLTIATDNDYLRSFGEVGLLGTFALGLIFFMLVWEMLKFIKRESDTFERAYVVGALCTIFVLLITAVFIDVLEASKIATLFWFLMGSAWAVMKKYST